MPLRLRSAAPGVAFSIEIVKGVDGSVCVCV